MTDPTVETEQWWGVCEAILQRAGSGADGGHDRAHARRVARRALAMAERLDEPVDRLVVLAAALLHDLVALPKDHPDRHQASRRAATVAVAELRAAGFPADRLAAVEHAIVAHAWSAGVAPATIEARLVQDADRLEALGAIGIARCFFTAGRLDSALAHPDDPAGDQREFDDRAWALDHFAVKLLRLPATMQTAVGRKLAAAGADELIRFRARFLAEWQGGSP